MIKIAILGDIGSGKTYVAGLFGFPVFNADKEVIKIYKKNKNCFFKLKKKFPNQITSFPIKKNLLINIILEKEKNLKIINKIVHPIVRLEMRKFLKKNKNKKAVVLDIPLFLENNLNKKDDYLIFINSKINDINRKINNRNSNLRLIKMLRKFQIPKKIKKKKADFIIYNNFRKKKVQNNVKIIKNIILKNEGNYS
tara:strand:+ start:5069 stop:5656 length:588 start_codon:yes stop_codon:yes gene_type:complete